MYQRIEKPKQNRSRALAPSVTQKKNNGTPGFTIMDNRAETHAQKKVQGIVDNSTQVRQLAAFQKIADPRPRVSAQYKQERNGLAAAAPVTKSGIIQRYSTTKDGKLVSSQKNLVLESDASKEFYATEAGFSKNKDALERGGVKNIEFTKGNAKKYDEFPENQYSKVLPIFKNVTDTRMKSETQLVDEKTEAQVQIPAWYDPFWLWAQLVNIGSGFQPRFYQAYMRSVGQNQGKVDEIGREIKARDTKNENISKAIEVLDELLSQVNEDSDDEIANISSFFVQPPGIQNVIEKSTRDFISTYWEKQSKKEVREGLKRIISRRKTELELQDQDPNAPYLPTDCQKLSMYLRGDKAENISSNKKGLKPEVGDYHHIDYSKKGANEKNGGKGPWDYHYGTILFKDGADTVTLEDAAGQGTPWEKSHWYFMMYGTKGKQTFKAKTDQEYERRVRIAPKDK